MQYNTIVIGGGVAGLTAGMYLAQANLPCLILEAKFWGGQTALLNKVANYPAVKQTSGFEISQTLYEQVSQLKIDMKLEQVISVSKKDDIIHVKTNKNQYTCKNIIIATGAKTAQLGLKEEKKFTGRGVSYCATCDGNFFKGKPVALFGVGKTALNDIKYLHNLASELYWIVPGKSLPLSVLNEIANLNKLKINYNSEVVELVGDSTLQSIVLLNKQKNLAENLEVSGLFVALGRLPDLSWLEIDIRKNKKGYVLVDKYCQTSLKGVFACGDITSRELKQIVTACSDGAIAATHIISKE